MYGSQCDEVLLCGVLEELLVSSIRRDDRVSVVDCVRESTSRQVDVGVWWSRFDVLAGGGCVYVGFDG